MSSPYDIARIQSGDPEAQVGRAAGATMAGLEQFKTKKDIIKQINDAYKAAQAKAKKKKGWYGLGGGLLGSLLGLGLGPIGTIIAGGLSAGAAEKYRQDIYDPTKELREVEEKFKGRREGQNLEEDIDLIAEGLDDAVLTDALVGAITTGIFQGGSGKKGIFSKGEGTLGSKIGKNIKTAQFGIPAEALDAQIMGMGLPQFAKNAIQGLGDDLLSQLALAGLKSGSDWYFKDMLHEDFTAPQLETTSRFKGYGGY